MSKIEEAREILKELQVPAKAAGGFVLLCSFGCGRYKRR